MTEQEKNIYQLKIKMFYGNRTILINNSMKFAELDDYLKEIYGWSDFHLSAFEYKFPKEEQLEREKIVHKKIEDAISKNIEPDFSLFRYTGGFYIGEPDKSKTNKYSWHDTKVKDILKEEKSKLIYIFDFGAYHTHTIILQKILPQDPSITYPILTKGDGYMTHNIENIDFSDEESNLEQVKACGFKSMEHFFKDSEFDITKFNHIPTKVLKKKKLI